MSGPVGRFLAGVCELDPPVIAPADVSDRLDAAAIQVLTRLKALVEAPPQFRIRCLACDDVHEVEVRLKRGGGFEAFCGSVGTYAVEARQLRRLRVDIGWLVGHARRHLGLPPDQREAEGDDVINHVGKARFGPYRCEVFIALRMGAAERYARAKAVLGRWIGSGPVIVITSADPDLLPPPVLPRVALVALADVLDLEVGDGRLDETPILAALRPRRGPPSDPIGFLHSPDFRTVAWSDQNFDFTKKQALVVEELNNAWYDGTFKRSQESLRALGVEQRITELFRDHPAYGTLILHDGQGLYWLDL